MTQHISVIVGSLRRGSFARKIAQNVLPMFPEAHEARIVEIRDLPLYDFDYDDPDVTDKPVPAEYTAFRETITASAGVLFVTPENNRTIPACLKNAIDIGSKPNSEVAWKGLPVGIISHSVGRMGGYSSQKNLRLALSYFDMPTVGQPEVFLSQSPDLFDGGEEIVRGSTMTYLQDYIDRLSNVVKEHGQSSR
ncbi:NADPH-dependent FMN reductase [Gulosibacter molinativorax]|uniref:NAD(P)H-dependent oxidoreductase n=1 Tax=Gulosibacter molinativorax TaxID=256821 RepID=A0ABT7C4X8_9MICO|nr:NADPH-dependent FMN reductase [Gulosibacter molinativorax]MDJ1370248.1 NAD(P)H-dependent oxidoreductase [Gulosibacter molinativorax]QUY61662.1 NAD(P)H dehydrogenase (Quinone) [Gulosibacter molinativorax]